MNRLGFYLSLLCGAAVIIFSSRFIRSPFFNWFGIHPLKLVFYFLMVVFVIGFIGFFGVFDWKGALRSIFTLGFSLFLWIFLAYIIFVGNLSDS
jgi:hypothetical protein